jgi:hypothetical protein
MTKQEKHYWYEQVIVNIANFMSKKGPHWYEHVLVDIGNLMPKQGTHLYEHVLVNIGILKPNWGKHSYQHVLVNIGYLMPNQGEALISTCIGEYWILNANESKTYPNMVVKTGVPKVGVLVYIV